MNLESLVTGFKSKCGSLGRVNVVPKGSTPEFDLRFIEFSFWVS
jgi:hypothetical protein